MGTANENNMVQVLEKGKYTLVGVDIDTTGRRLIDEIVQLSAYNPAKEQFAQYIMPYMNLNPAARQRHQIRVITIGFYRMLKCMQSYKVVKSKSEIASLRDFLDWLETLHNSDTGSNGVILLYHEERKFAPYMLLEAFKKYGLLGRFLKTVKSFANGYELAKATCDISSKQYSLRQLSKVLLNKNEITDVDVDVDVDADAEKPTGQLTNKPGQNSDQQQQNFFEGNASVRAKLAFEIAEYLAGQSAAKDLENENIAAANNDGPDTDDMQTNLNNLVQKFAPPTSIELDELEVQNQNLERQNSFRPVFLQYFKTTLYHRVRAVKFRIILAENGHDLDALKAIWTEKRKEGLTEVIQALHDLKPDEKDELIDLLDAHYDPSKNPLKPVIKKPKKRARRNKNKENMRPRDSNTNQGAGDERSQLTDSTSPPSKRNGKNRSRNNAANHFNGKQAVSTN